nr:hypothetical protein CFP56_68449 [Quercus suber]
MRQNQVDPEFVASNNNSDPGSPTINEERSESLIEHSSLSISIASLFPPYIVQNPTKHLKCHSSHQPGPVFPLPFPPHLRMSLIDQQQNFPFCHSSHQPCLTLSQNLTKPLHDYLIPYFNLPTSQEDPVVNLPSTHSPAKCPASPILSLEVIASAEEETRKKKKVGGKSFLPSFWDDADATALKAYEALFVNDLSPLMPKSSSKVMSSHI